ncbi:Dystonin, partial [Schistosoma japonicum]
MYFLETLVSDINSLDCKLKALHRYLENCYHLAHLQVFCDEFYLLRGYCQTILGQIELWIMNCLHTSNIHRLNSYEEIGLWINDFNDFGKIFENLTNSLTILQNIIENSHKIAYYTNINNVISFFDCVQQTRLNSIANVEEIMDYLNLNHFYDVHVNMISEAIVTGSNIKKFILQDATLIEALDLCNNRRSFNNLFYENKDRRKIHKTKIQYHGYIKNRMKHTLHNIGIMLSDCYWLLLGSKLISFNSHLKMESEMSDEKVVMVAIQSGNCTILANSQRIFSKLINHLTCYQPILLNSSSIHAKYLPYCNSLIQYHDYFNYVKHNLNLLKNDDKNSISKFMTNANASEEHFKCFYSIIIRLNSLFESLKDMRDSSIVGLNLSSSDSFTPVTVFTSVLNLTIGAQQQSTDKIEFNSNNRYLRTYYRTNPTHNISNYYSELYVTIQKNSCSLKCNNKELMPLIVTQNQGNFINTSEGKCSYRTCAYLSWFKQHIIPVSLVVDTTTETADCDFIKKWDIFIIWQGQVNQFNDSNQSDLKQTDISFDHTIKSESVASCYVDPIATATTAIFTTITKSETDDDTDHDSPDYTLNDVTQITDGKFSPVSVNSNKPIDDKSHDDSAYQTLYVNDNDPIKWDGESIINGSCDTFDINSEISTTLMKQIPTNRNVKSVLDVIDMDNNLVCTKRNLPNTDSCDESVNHEISTLSKISEIHHNVVCQYSSQCDDYEVMGSLISSSCSVIDDDSNHLDKTILNEDPVEHNFHHRESVVINRSPSKQQYDFIDSSLNQLEDKLSCISRKFEEMEKRNEQLTSAKYIKEIDNIFQLLLLVKDETSQIEYILSSSNMKNESLSVNNDNVNITVNSGDSKYTVISSQSSERENPILEVNPEEIYQHNVSKRLSTVKCLRDDLMRRCDKLVECLEEQECRSPVNINTNLKFISQNLVSLAHKMDDPDYDAINDGTNLSTIGLVHIETNLKQLKCIQKNSLSCESITTLDCIEGELVDMQINLQNKMMYLNNFYKKLSDLSSELQAEFNWIKQQESDLILNDIPSELNDSQVNGQNNNNHGHLERDINVLCNLLAKLSQYQENKLLPMLENYDRLISDDASLHGLQWTILTCDTQNNMDLVQNIRNLWVKVIKELIPRKFQELITRSYEQITKNLASTFQYLPSLQSFEFLFPDGNVPESDSIQCRVNVILDHINVIQSEMNWLNQHLKPIIINEDRLNLFTDTTSATTIINTSTKDYNPNINNEIATFQEVNQGLTQLLSYFTQMYQYLSTYCIPAIDKYHEITNHSLDYINTIQQQMELFRAILSSVCSSNNKDNDDECEGTCFIEEHNENVECILIIYEKLETLCTGREQCLELLQNAKNNHQTIINELMDIVKHFQSPFNEIQVMDTEGYTTTETMTARKVTDTDITSSNNYTSEILEPAESISHQLLYFISEIQKIISEYDQSISTISRHKIPKELSVDWNALNLEEDLQESELLQDECIFSVNKYQHHINEFDKQYNHLLNASYTNWWPNDVASWHTNGKGLLNEINKTSEIEGDEIPQTDIQSYDKKPISTNNDDFLNDILQNVGFLESNLKLSCCNFINNDQLNSRLNDVSELRIDITDKITQIMKANEQLRSSSQQIEHTEEKLNILKSTFIQSADLLQNVISRQSESESQNKSFETYAQIIRKQLSVTNNVISELQELTDEFSSTDYLIQNYHLDINNTNVFPSKIMHDEKSLRLDLINHYENIAYLSSFTVPLWYKQIKINNEVMNFLEHVKNHRQRLLYGYELAERLSIWVSVAHPRISKLKGKLQHLSLKTVDLIHDSINPSSHLHDLTVYRLELFSQLPMIQCILKDTNEFNDVVLDLSEDYKIENTIDCIQQNVLSDFNKCEHRTSLQAQIVHHTSQVILTIVNDFDKSLTESSAFLSATRNHLIETNQIPTILNEFANLLNEFSCLDEKFMQNCMVEEFLINSTENYLSIAQNQHWMKLKYMELWYNEFKSIQTVLTSVSNHQYLSTSIDHNNIQNEMKQIRLKSEQLCRYLTRKKIELTNEINK